MKKLFPYLVQVPLALVIGIIWATSPKVPQLVVVDMSAVISQGSKNLVSTGKISPQDIQEWGDNLKDKLHAFGQDRHLILLAKGAVVGDSLPDMTEEVLGIIDSGELS
jgi:hypothetical protein